MTTEKSLSKQVVRRRNKIIQIRVTESELKRFNNSYVKSKENSKADYLNLLMHNSPIIIYEGLTETLIELQRIGNNINQISRHLNSNEYEYKEYIASCSKQLIATITKIYNLLCGD